MLPKFLTNGPIRKDLFEGKSQEKTAETLCNILKRDDFQVIGIDGGWGTGKSNLVSIIEDKLKTQNFHFFIYDVWGHQEDEQRRAILEELTEKILKDNLLSDKSKWNDKIKRLLAKEKEVTTINRPYLGIGVVFTLFSIIYVPTVTIFAKDLPTTFSKFGLNSLIWKLLIVGFPLILVVITFLWHLFEQLIIAKKGWTSIKISMQKTFQVYNNKQIDETKIETISENEPTVKDFRGWLNEIDKDLKTKKLVLVFDNFDRLPKKNILSLWSSIHVFFAEEKYKNIKVIIPFDRQHIKSAFQDLSKNVNDNPEYSKNIKNNYSEDYINKTFDIVYRVSPPILSNWKSYFKEKWVEAIGAADSEEYERVLQLYEIFNDTITPREVIVFINEIVSLKLLFNGKIPDQYLGLFILNKEKLLSEPLKELSEPSYLSGASYLYKNDDNLAKYMTAIVYQIDPDNAIEVVYTKQLKSALVNRDYETFKTISNSSFFPETIFVVLKEIVNVEYPIETLDTIDKETITNKHTLTLVWRQLYAKSILYTIQEFELRNFQKILLKNIDLGSAREWLKFILNTLYLNNNFNAEMFSKIVDEINHYASTNSIDLNVFEFLQRKDVGIELFIPFVTYKQEDCLKYELYCTDSEINNYLIGLEVESLVNVKYVKWLSKKYSLNTFKKEIETKINQFKADKTKLDILYERLKDVSEDLIDSLLSDAEIATLFTQSLENEPFYYDLIAMRLSRLNLYSPSYASIFDTILKSDDENISEKIAERIQYYIHFDDFLLGSNNFKDVTLYKSVSKKIITKDYRIPRAEIRSLLLSFEEICTNTGVDPQILLEKLNRWEYVKEDNSDVIDFPNLLYSTSLLLENSLSKSLLDNAKVYFTELDKISWINIFDNTNSKLFKLLQIINFNGWNSYSTDAMLESLEKQVTAGEILNTTQWEYVFNSYDIAKIPLHNLFKSIRDMFYGNRSLINKNLFAFLIKYFEKWDILNDKPGDAFRTIFKIEFLDDIATLIIYLEKSDYIKRLMLLCNPNQLSDFKQGIIDRYENSEQVKKLAIALEISIEKQ